MMIMYHNEFSYYDNITNQHEKKTYSKKSTKVNKTEHKYSTDRNHIIYQQDLYTINYSQ